MKLLIVAHFDDEICWFNPKDFDKIIICFGDRDDNPEISEARKRVLKLHPLKEKIKSLNIKESNYWRDDTKLEEHQKNYETLKELLKEDIEQASEIYTHNPWGEYGHTDHILVNQAVMELAKCPTYVLDGIKSQTAKKRIKVKTDIETYYKIKRLYVKESAWTWDMYYCPPQYRYYFKL